MFRAGAEIINHALGLIYPPACLICDAHVSSEQPLRHGLCSECFSVVTTDPLPSCIRCSQSVGPFTDTIEGCLECRGTNFGFERTIRLGIYTGKLRDAVLRTKFLAGEGLADMLGRLFAEARGAELSELGIDIVAPVPLHWWRKWKRGFNQSESVARELAAGMSVAFHAHLLSRVRWTPQQTQPTRSARQDNVKGAFRVGRGARVGGRTVLLVDDVMTTGSTANEIARTLLAAGAEKVVVAVLARR